jgi:hypothetical protein
MTPAEKTYAAMSDDQIVAFVRANLPESLLWRAEHRPKCSFIREAIIRELERRPLLVEKGDVA